MEQNKTEVFVIDTGMRLYYDAEDLFMVLIPSDKLVSEDGGWYDIDEETIVFDKDNHADQISMKEIIQFYIDNNEKFKSKGHNIKEMK